MNLKKVTTLLEDPVYDRYIKKQSKIFSEKVDQKPSIKRMKTKESLNNSQMIVSKVITLEALNQISFADLNNKSTDDFNPADFGFEENPNEQASIKPVMSFRPSRQGTRSLLERA